MKRIIVASAFVVLSAIAAIAYEPPASMFGQSNSLVPANTTTATSNFTVGINFTANTSGVIRRLSFFKSSSDTTTSRNLILWSGGTNLAQCTTSNEPTGFNQWIGCNIPAYDISSGTILLVSYDIPSGSVFAANNSGVCLQMAPQRWISCNSIWYTTSLSTFPTTSDAGTQYVDIVLEH